MAFIPLRDREYLEKRGLRYEELVDAAQNAIAIRGFLLPHDKFDHTCVDLLVILPGGYPDTAPDMFHTLPWIRLVAGNKFPNAADQPVQFAGSSWQRWSRHSNEWRSGRDGIWTMMKRIENALEVAV